MYREYTILRETKVSEIFVCSVQRELGFKRALSCGALEWEALVLLPIIDTLRRGLRHLQLLVYEIGYESVLNYISFNNIDIHSRQHQQHHLDNHLVRSSCTVNERRGE